MLSFFVVRERVCSIADVECFRLRKSAKKYSELDESSSSSLLTAVVATVAITPLPLRCTKSGSTLIFCTSDDVMLLLLFVLLLLIMVLLLAVVLELLLVSLTVSSSGSVCGGGR